MNQAIVDAKLVRAEFAKIKKMIICCMPLTCQNCGCNEGIEIHHIVPIIYGGSNKITNLASLCGRCHRLAHGDGNGTGISARTARGREAAKARGVKFGPKVRHTPEKLAAAVEFARLEGKSVTVAAKMAGCSRATLYNYIQSESRK